MDVEIRSGGDWVEVLVSGKKFCEGHGLTAYDMARLLDSIPGVSVTTPQGDFCSWCCKWSTEPLVNASDGDSPVCVTCEATGEVSSRG